MEHYGVRERERASVALSAEQFEQSVYSRTRRCQIMRVTVDVYVNRSGRLSTPHVKFLLRVWSRNERGTGFF